MSDKDEIFDYVMNTPDNTNPAILRGLLDDLNSSNLPPVTAADKGKFLHANESTGDLEWAAAAPSGGGILTVTGTYGETAHFGGPGYTLDKTYAEIHAALEAKTPVFVWQNESAGGGPGMICLLATESYYYTDIKAYFIDAGNPGTDSSSRKRIQYVARSESDYPVGTYGEA